MTIDLSTITFTNGADIVPESGEEAIVNTGITNTLAGNDTITGIGGPYDIFNPSTGNQYGIFNTGTFDTAEGNDIITGNGGVFGIFNTGTFDTAEGNDIIIANTVTYDGIRNLGTFNTGEGNDINRVC